MANKAITRFSRRWSKALREAKTFRVKPEPYEKFSLIWENAPAHTRGGVRYWLVTRNHKASVFLDVDPLWWIPFCGVASGDPDYFTQQNNQ